jgi:hypothetical protein
VATTGTSWLRAYFQAYCAGSVKQSVSQNGLHSSIDTFAEEKISGEMLLVSPTVADPECGFFLFDDVSISQ